MKLPLIVLLVLVVNHVQAQDNMHGGIGFAVASLNSPQSIASGLSLYAGRDIFKMPKSSFSICTYIKIGTEDKTGLIFPAGLVLLWLSARSDNSLPDIDLSKLKVKLFTEAPLLLHYNWGLGSNNDCYRRFGLYFGGGIGYTITGYTDTSGSQQGASFFGYVTDGGIRFHRNVDINFSRTVPLQNIGQIKSPAFYELTIMRLF